MGINTDLPAMGLRLEYSHGLASRDVARALAYVRNPRAMYRRGCDVALGRRLKAVVGDQWVGRQVE